MAARSRALPRWALLLAALSCLAAAPAPEGLGAALAPVTDDLREFMGLPAGVRGALVLEAKEGGAAARAGLKKGDVIVRLGSADLAAIPDEAGLAAAVRAALEGGKEVEAAFLRDGKPGTVRIARLPETAVPFGEARAGAYRVRGDLDAPRLARAAEALEEARLAFSRELGVPLAPKGALSVAAFGDEAALARSVAEALGLAAAAPARETYLGSRRVLAVVVPPEGFSPAAEARRQVLSECWPGAPLPEWLLEGAAALGGLSGERAPEPRDLEAAANAIEADGLGGIPGMLEADVLAVRTRPGLYRPAFAAFTAFLAGRAARKEGEELPGLVASLRAGTPWAKSQPGIFRPDGMAALSRAFADWLLSRARRTDAAAREIRRRLGVPVPDAPKPAPPAEDRRKEEEAIFEGGFG